MRNPKFKAVLDEMLALHDKKNADYAPGDDPLANFKESLRLGILPFKGCVVRMSDKWMRVCTFVKSGNYAVKKESFRDTLIDMANYSVLGILLWEDELKKENKNGKSKGTRRRKKVSNRSRKRSKDNRNRRKKDSR